MLLNAEGSTVLSKLGPNPSSSCGRIRSLIKSLLLIGAALSQAREFRDLIEDIVTKVGDFSEEAGLTSSDINTLLLSCAVLGDCIPNINNSGRLSLEV